MEGGGRRWVSWEGCGRRWVSWEGGWGVWLGGEERSGKGGEEDDIKELFNSLSAGVGNKEDVKNRGRHVKPA